MLLIVNLQSLPAPYTEVSTYLIVYYSGNTGSDSA